MKKKQVLFSILLCSTPSTTISQEQVVSYNGYTSLGNFCEMLLVEPIMDWQDIDDARAIQMVQEILDNVTDDAVLLKNGEALEKRYRKASGFLGGLIFHSGIESPNEILKELKKDTTIYL